MPASNWRTSRRAVMRAISIRLNIPPREVIREYAKLPQERQDELIESCLDYFGLERPECESVYIRLRTNIGELINYICRERRVDRGLGPSTAVTIEIQEGDEAREQISKGVLQAFRRATGIKASLDTQVSQIIGDDLSDEEFLMHLQEKFPRLLEEDLERIRELYPVPGNDLHDGGGGLSLGRKAKEDRTFRGVADYIFERYQHPVSEKQQALIE